MKKISLTVLGFLLAYTLFAQSWTQATNIPGFGRRGAVSLTINGKIYVGGGLDSLSALIGDFYEYDPATNAWAQKGNLPANLGGCACFTINGKGYLVSGAAGGGNVVNTAYQYDPLTDTWTSIAAFPGTARENSYGFTIADTGYVFGGFGGSELNDLWAYNSTNNTWSQKASMPSSTRSTISGFVINNVAYVGLGEYNSSQNFASDIGAYNAATNTWGVIAQFPGHLRAGQVCFTIGNFGYLGFGAYDSAGITLYYNDIYQYDVAHNSWSHAGSFPGVGRSTGVSQNVGDIIYVGSGSNAVSFTRDWWRFIYHVGVSMAPGQNVCTGSQVILNPVVAGAIEPVTYNWSSTGNALSCNNCATPSVTITQNSTYYLTVTDANNTQAFDTVTYTVSSTSNGVQASLANTNISCQNPVDTTTALVSGGTIPFTFQWGDGTSGTGVSATLHTYSQSGVYVFSVTDSAGCVSSLFDTILNSSVAITVSKIVSPICLYDSSGKIFINVTGGTAPYAYTWTTGSTADSSTHLPAGDYSVTVTDINSCSTQLYYELNPAGDVWDYYVYLSGTDPNCSNNGTLTVTPYGGFTPYNYTWNNGGTTQTIQSLPAGNYSVVVTDSTGCPRVATGTLNFNCASTISGYVFIDSNQNCIFDSSESAVSFTFITATSANTGNVYYGYTDGKGGYAIVVTDTGTYNIQIANYDGTCANYAMCGNPGQNVTIAQLGDSSVNNNFTTNVTSGFDLTIHPGWTSADPGFQKEYWVMPYNQSGLPFNGTATVVFKYDSNLVYQYSLAPLPAVDTVAHTLTWMVNNVPSPGWDWVNVRFENFFQVPTTLSLGQLLYSSFSITPTVGDCDSSNNFLHFSETVIGSHDPNEKTVEPANNISPDDSVLTYTIHFQNTGTDSTRFIIVTDTLSPYLDPASVRTLASSSPYSAFNISGKGFLSWTFNPLRLVDSITNPSGSKGFITFSVKKFKNLPLGSVISNTAYVYFDYNNAVITNTVSDTVALPTGVLNVKGNSAVSVKAYPNPFSQVTHISVNGISGKYDFELYDVTGRLKRRISAVDSYEFELMRNDMAAGMYFYRIVISSKQLGYGKLVIQ